MLVSGEVTTIAPAEAIDRARLSGNGPIADKMSY